MEMERNSQRMWRISGPYGYGGVQVSPVNENAVIDNPSRPWWERYQPVSYKLHTRSGTEAELKDMIERCNKVNVRIYVDAVTNHMTGGQSGFGTDGAKYDGNEMVYPNLAKLILPVLINVINLIWKFTTMIIPKKRGTVV